MIVSVKPQHIAGGAKKTPQERIRIRKEKTLPALDEYFKWIRSFDPDHIIKGKFRDGIVYSQSQEEALRAFLLDGRLPCSNNAAERSIKPFVISRKNFLFCKTPSGAKATATVFSLIETAKANSLDPFKYLVYIFEKLSQDEDYDLEQLMPWTKAVVDTCKAPPANDQAKRRTSVIAGVNIMAIVGYNQC